MAVYILRLGERGPVVKIGTAKNVAKRIAGLQTASHERLVLLREFEGGRAEEHQLHRLFADHRISREFFTFSKAMLRDVGLVEVKAHIAEPVTVEQLDELIAIWGEARDRGLLPPLRPLTPEEDAAQVRELNAILALYERPARMRAWGAAP